MRGTLYICATPIGNLADASPRLVETLRNVDFIAAEDTRHSAKLLAHFGCETPLLSYHEHSDAHRHAKILAALAAGKSVALISDAGTPGICDPGEELIRDAIAAGVTVSIIPGPMAAVAALAVSGLPTSRFAFEGFLPREKSERRRVLARLCSEERTLVFYEAPHRLEDTLTDLLELFGDRQCAVVRELTKMYESVRRGHLSMLLGSLRDEPARGEIVVVVAGAKAQAEFSDREAGEIITILLGRGFSPAQAARHAAQVSGRPRAELYALAVEASARREKK